MKEKKKTTGFGRQISAQNWFLINLSNPIIAFSSCFSSYLEPVYLFIIFLRERVCVFLHTHIHLYNTYIHVYTYVLVSYACVCVCVFFHGRTMHKDLLASLLLSLYFFFPCGFQNSMECSARRGGTFVRTRRRLYKPQLTFEYNNNYNINTILIFCSLVSIVRVDLFKLFTL